MNITRSRIEPAHPKILIEPVPKGPIGLIEPVIVLKRIRYSLSKWPLNLKFFRFKGRISNTTMANGETSRTTTSKLNKNQQNTVHDANSTPPSSNVQNRGNGDKTTTGGGRLRRRSAPPVTLEGN